MYRYKFYNINQEQCETIDDFINRLKVKDMAHFS